MNEEKKLTDEEVVKALRKQPTYDTVLYLEKGINATDILDLIYRLQVENESLKKQIEELPKPRKKILANRVYSDSTLKKWSKEDLIEQIRILEHNWASAEQKAEIERMEKRNGMLLCEKDAMEAQCIGFQKQVDELTEENNILSKVIGSSKRKTKILELQKEIERLKLSLREQCAEDHRLGLENDKIILQNKELQKQVDELKASNEHLDSENTRLVCEMSKLLDDGWDIMDKEAENCYNKGYQQAVKDTAKEILITTIQLSDMCESFYEFQNRLIDLIEINYGIEVETKTIIPEKAVEVE